MLTIQLFFSGPKSPTNWIITDVQTNTILLKKYNTSVENFTNYKIVSNSSIHFDYNCSGVEDGNCTVSKEEKAPQFLSVTNLRSGHFYVMNIFTDIGGLTSDQPLSLFSFTGKLSFNKPHTNLFIQLHCRQYQIHCIQKYNCDALH